MNIRSREHVGMLLLVLLIVFAFAFPSFAEEQDEKLVPEDTCIVELKLPDGAKVSASMGGIMAKNESW